MTKRSVFLRTTGVLAAVVAVYVASYGPLYGYVIGQHAAAPGDPGKQKRWEILLQFYAPLRLLAGATPLTKRALDSYWQCFMKVTLPVPRA